MHSTITVMPTQPTDQRWGCRRGEMAIHTQHSNIPCCEPKTISRAAFRIPLVLPMPRRPPPLSSVPQAVHASTNIPHHLLIVAVPRRASGPSIPGL